MPLRAVEIPPITASRIIPPEALETEALRCGYAYWCAQRGTRRFPARSDIKPRDIAGILRHISLLKFEHGDFIYRIVGDVVVRAFDIPMQNRSVSELSKAEPGFGTIIRPMLEKCRTSGEPIAVQGQTGRDVFRVTFTDYENVLLPLGTDDTHVDHILVVSQYLAQPYA